MRKVDGPTKPMLRELENSLERLTAPEGIGGANEGPWVLVGVLLRKPDSESIPVMEGRKRLFMRRFATCEEAIAASVLHSATRVNGGWALNLETGETVKVRAFEGRVV